MRSTFIHTAIVFISFCNLTLAALNLSSSPEDDALSLLAFKSKADLHSKLRYSVNTSSNHCKWRGVQCQSDGRVDRLVLENLSLAGVFAAGTLTLLDQLRVLSLQNNSLTGPIPDLAGLVNLKALFLDHNSFNGAIPPSISALHRLRTLDLSYNKLSGVIPVEITNLDRLNYLRLDSNRFNGSIPPLNQSSLQIFNVSVNTLTGPVPVTPTLANFTASSFSSNPGLCGEIVRTECSSIAPFFGKNSTASPSLSPPPRVVLGQSAQLQQGMAGFTNSNPRNHKRFALIVGFSAGVLALITSIICILISIKTSSDKKKKRKDVISTTEIMAAASMADAAAEVMRMEETNELEEKVRKLQQGMAMGKSGNLVFCAGETQVYTLEQLMRASAELLGRGTVATTYKAVLDNRLIVCVKRLDAGRLAGTTSEAFERHMEAVGGLRHPNLVPLRAYFQAKEERLLVYDYQANGSLSSLIHGSKSTRAKPLHWTSCLKIAEDVAQGLSYIHQAWRLVHGNLKSSNVLLGSDFEACLTDYCLSTLAGARAGGPDSTAHEPPETLKLNHQPTAKSDVYSFGVLLLELLTGKPAPEHPFLTPEEMVKWVKAARDGEAEEDNRVVMVAEVAVVCRVSSPEQRPTMWDVLKMIQEVKEAAAVIEELEGPDGTE